MMLIPRFSRCQIPALFLWIGLCPNTLMGQTPQTTPPPKPTPYDIKANYTKYEYRIPMRDGKKLFTAVYVPKDQSQTYPILLIRTPYSVKPYGADQYKDA